MKYSDFRANIKSGDILAWSHKGWSSLKDLESQIVRIVTRSEYSHVGVAWVFAGRVFVIESVVPKIRIVPLSNLLPCYHVSIVPPKGQTFDWTPDVEAYAMSLVGVGTYSKCEAIKGFLKAVKAQDSSWQCAKFVWCVMTKMSVDLDLKNVITPSSIVASAQMLDCTVRLLEE